MTDESRGDFVLRLRTYEFMRDTGHSLRSLTATAWQVELELVLATLKELELLVL